VPYRVLPRFPNDSIEPLEQATVRMEAAVGDEHLDADGPIGWVHVETLEDLHRAYRRWTRRVVEAPQIAEEWLAEDEEPEWGVALDEPEVYRHRPGVLPAAALLLDPVDDEDLRGAVVWRRATRRSDGGEGPIEPLEELLVRWDALRRGSRPSARLFLVDVARSLLEGDPVDLRQARALRGDPAERFVLAMRLVAGDPDAVGPAPTDRKPG